MFANAIKGSKEDKYNKIFPSFKEYYTQTKLFDKVVHLILKVPIEDKITKIQKNILVIIILSDHFQQILINGKITRTSSLENCIFQLNIFIAELKGTIEKALTSKETNIVYVDYTPQDEATLSNGINGEVKMTDSNKVTHIAYINSEGKVSTTFITTLIPAIANTKSIFEIRDYSYTDNPEGMLISREPRYALTFKGNVIINVYTNSRRYSIWDEASLSDGIKAMNIYLANLNTYPDIPTATGHSDEPELDPNKLVQIKNRSGQTYRIINIDDNGEVTAIRDPNPWPDCLPTLGYKFEPGELENVPDVKYPDLNVRA
jgi:hypothetical protein